MLRIRRLLTLLAGCVALAGASHAAIIIDNYPTNDGSGRGLSNTQAQGMGFTMLGDYTFDQVTLRFSTSTVAPPTSAVSVGIYSNSGSNKPETLLVGTTGPAEFLNNTAADYTYTPASAITFDAGTTYWLVVHYTSNHAFQWKQSDPQVDPSGTGAVYFGNSFANPFPNWDGGTFERGIFQLEGTPLNTVPEPGFLALPGLALLVWLHCRRRSASR